MHVIFTKNEYIRDGNQDLHTFYSIIPSHKIAEKMGVEHIDIINLFKKWKEAGHPQEFLLKTDEGITSRGKPYPIGLLLWNYQGGYEDSKGPVSSWGYICMGRAWGSSYRGLDDSFTSYYSLEPEA